MLREVARLFREEPDKIEQNRAALLARLAEKARPAGKVTIGLKELDAAARADRQHVRLRQRRPARRAEISAAGDLGNALARRHCARGDARFFETVEHTLERMSEGGIYDHLGGGFSRYSVDERWLVPHFEKMLYDNAQLLELLALACQRSGNAAVRAARARDGRLAQARDDDDGGRVLPPRSMPTPKARRASSTSGRRTRSSSCSGPEAGEFFARHYDVSDDGNFEGHNILNRLHSVPRSTATTRRGSRRCARCCSRRARPACGPGSTTRCWPTGTG